MVEGKDLTIKDHVLMQAAVQRWTDAAVYKTINVSEETSYEQFKEVYDLAYTAGCKGCTTYRPSDVRGSILSRTPTLNTPSQQAPQKEVLLPRTDTLSGITHKIKWPSWSSALYMTVNHTEDGQPFEVFFNSKDARNQEWMVATSLLITAILRKVDNDIAFIGEELMSVHSINDTA